MARRGFQLIVAMVLASGVIARADDYTWTGQASDNAWSQKANWAGGVVPASSDTTRLIFDQSAHGTLLLQSIANPFIVNQISFGGVGFDLYNLPLAFAGGGAGILQNSAADQVFEMPISLLGTTTIGGVGSGKVVFNGNVSGVASLVANVPIALGTGTVSLTGSQTYNSGLSFTTVTTLSSSGGGDISCNGPVDGSSPLILQTSGVMRLGGVVGGVIRPFNLATDAGGTTVISGNAISTVSAQDYRGPVTLAAGTTLDAQNGSIDFSSSIDGGFGLVVNSGVRTTFAKPVGGTAALANLIISGPAVIKGGSITTVGGQSFNSKLTLGGDATLTSTSGGDISFSSAVDGAFNLTVNTSGSSIIAAAMGGTTALASFTTDGGGTTTINGSNVTIRTTGAQAYRNTLLLPMTTTLTSTGGGNISLGNVQGLGTASFGSLVVTTAGTTTFAGQSGNVVPLLTVTTDLAGVTALSGAGITTQNGQTYGDPVSVSGVATLKSLGSGSITFVSTLDGPGALSIGQGTVAFNGAVGSTSPLASLSTGNGTITVKGGLVRTTGGQTYPGPVNLNSDTTFKSEGGGDITFTSSFTGSTKNIFISTSGVTTIPQLGANDVQQIVTDAPGRTVLNLSFLTTSKAQTFGDAVTLLKATTLTSSQNGNITLGGSVDGGSLTLNTSGVKTLGGPIGVVTAVSGLFTGSTGSTVIGAGSINTTNGQFYQNPVTVIADTTFTDNASVDFRGTVNGPAGVVIAPTGSTFSGAVGGVTPLASLAAGSAFRTTTINGGGITTTGAQSYGGPVTLGAATTLTSTDGGDIALNGGISGNFPISINTSGTTTLKAFVSGIPSLTTDAPGRTVLNSSSTINTAGSQTYGDAVILAAQTTLNSSSGGTIRLGSTVNGAFPLTIFTSGAVSFGGAVGDVTPPTSLTLTAADVNGAAVTAGTITQNSGNVTTSFSGLLRATGAGGITLKGNDFTLGSVTTNPSATLSVTDTGVAVIGGVVSGGNISKFGVGSLTLAGVNTYTGSTQLNAGTLRVRGSIAASGGTFVNSSAVFEAVGTQTVKSLRINNGGLAKVTAGVLTAKPGQDGTPLTISTGASAGTHDGRLDLMENALIVDYAPGNEDTTLALVQARVRTGYHGGDWAGDGIFSSSAAADSTKAMGYAQASEVLGPGGGLFMDQTVDGTSLLVRYTLAGDADLNGTVDFNDLAKLAQNYNVTDGTRGWSAGDFTYDGNVDFLDLAKLAQNYNTALPIGSIPGPSAAFEADLVAAFSAVPEPSAAALLLGGCLIGRVSRRPRP
ncbi:MAG: hypothetical protein JWN40_5139 [Phycisphaerales bacterium]|nr:hypothetical protein [Phycisphaerales bacterium]